MLSNDATSTYWDARDELEHDGDVLPVPCSAIEISSVAAKLLLILGSFYESDTHWENFIIRALA